MFSQGSERSALRPGRRRARTAITATGTTTGALGQVRGHPASVSAEDPGEMAAELGDPGRDRHLLTYPLFSNIVSRLVEMGRRCTQDE